MQPSHKTQTTNLPGAPYVKQKSHKQAVTLLHPGNVFHIPRAFLTQHFDLTAVLADGLDVQINAAGELNPVVHVRVAEHKNKNGYSYNRLLDFRGVTRRYKGWRVDGWQALDHKTVRITLCPPPSHNVSTSKAPRKDHVPIVQADGGGNAQSGAAAQQHQLLCNNLLVSAPAQPTRPATQQHEAVANCGLSAVQARVFCYAQQLHPPQQQQQPAPVHQLAPRQAQQPALDHHQLDTAGHAPAEVLQQPIVPQSMQYTSQSAACPAPLLINGVGVTCTLVPGPGVLVAVPWGQGMTAQHYHHVVTANPAGGPVVTTAPCIAFQPATSYGPVMTSLLSQPLQQAPPPPSHGLAPQLPTSASVPSPLGTAGPQPAVAAPRFVPVYPVGQP